MSDRKYGPSELARIFGIHSNTVRLYEKIGFITPAERGSNNYRYYTDIQRGQIEICRLIFGYPFSNRNIRDTGNKLLRASAGKKWDTAIGYADIYLKIIDNEIVTAQNTADIVQQWSDGRYELSLIHNVNSSMSRPEAADYLGVTVETIRNWERNGLIVSITDSTTGEHRYYGHDLEQMCIVYMLRQAGYSMASIHRCISQKERSGPDWVINTLESYEWDELNTLGDRWLFELTRLKEAALKIKPILLNLEKNY